ncbi:MAG: DUF4017 family protein [Clostridia bacterium]|nr:DUF4017 family protein [Clostridia bacterium]
MLIIIQGIIYVNCRKIVVPLLVYFTVRIVSFLIPANDGTLTQCSRHNLKGSKRAVLEIPIDHIVDILYRLVFINLTVRAKIIKGYISPFIGTVVNDLYKYVFANYAVIGQIPLNADHCFTIIPCRYPDLITIKIT